MAKYKTPSEGGSGGRRGHSNMEHWTNTEELKDAAILRRRQDDRRAAKEGMEDTPPDDIVVRNVSEIEMLPAGTTALYVRRINDAMGAAIARTVPGVESIVQDGSASDLTDQGVAYLASLSDLRVLDLEWAIRLTDTSAEHLAQLRLLRYLDLGGCAGISEAAVRQLRRALPECEIVTLGGSAHS